MSSGVSMPSWHAEGNRHGSVIARTLAPCVVFRPEHVRTSLAREPGDLRFALEPSPGSHREGPEAIADDERDEEVRLIDSTCEASEQSGAIRCGVAGARRWDQEESTPSGGRARTSCTAPSF